MNRPPSDACRQSPGQPGFSAIDEITAIERFATNYTASLARLLMGHFAPGLRLLDFGAGLGTLARLWGERTGRCPECLEIDPTLSRELRQRGLTVHSDLEDVPGLFDGVYTSNVLEHIEDDVGTLGRIRAVMAPGATVAVYVPAFQCLYTDLDRLAGHWRRYGRKELTGKLRAAGFEVLAAHYVDCLGFPASLAVKALGYRKESLGLGNHALLRAYDRFVYPASAFLDRLGLRQVMGKNLLATARNPGA